MTKKLLVIPDVHGETFWKVPVSRFIDQVDRIIFLGDYLDPYPAEGKNYSVPIITDNLMDIIDLKSKNIEKVVLLKGNHDQHYSSEVFRELAGGSRMDPQNWNKYHDLFTEYKNMFLLVYLEEVNGLTYVFSHAGMTQYWLHKVNFVLWHLPDDKVSIADPDIIERINLLDADKKGQELLSVTGRCRSWFGEKTGSVLWADIEEHSIPDAPNAYGLDHVFQVFGHTRLDREKADKIEYDNIVMVDSQQCFMIDESRKEKIVTVEEYYGTKI